jgi:hypothetical protein
MRRTLLSSALRHGSPLLLACLLAPLTHAQEARPPRADQTDAKQMLLFWLLFHAVLVQNKNISAICD